MDRYNPLTGRDSTSHVSPEPPHRTRFPLMVLGIFSLLVGLGTGLVRLGWELPFLQPALLSAHGPLMVSGFLGTLIGLERAVALKHRWVYAAPLLTGLGALALIMGLPGLPGPLLMTLGSLGLVVASVKIIYHQPTLFTVITGLGTLVWWTGNILWLIGWPIYHIVFWWIGFLVLTIAGERLELSRLLLLSRRIQGAFLLAGSLFLIGLILTPITYDMGVRLAGIGMIALMLWLLFYDIARRTVHHSGLTRFTALCLLSGYVWLGVSGLLALLFGGVVAGPHYDAILHSTFLGFVFAMIFGHAPIILPAITRLPVPFRLAFYLHLALLHFSLLLRVIGDLSGWLPGRQWGGLLNAIALLLFLANTGHAVLKSTGKTSHHK
ncbi:MAG TPA: hypothetical protein VNM22_12665 [Candidatus Limnocylindrales bacterium]|nr:hypothetical protein [Candidatus Limnocylindrales bacterium]